MNRARKAFVDLLYGLRPTVLLDAYESGEHPEREKDVDVLLALHAHELAERIRTTDLPEIHVDMFDNGSQWAADLIDPKTED